MVYFVLVKGRKGRGDTLVKVYSNGEVLAFSDLLFLLQHYFRSEDSYYPREKGFQGSKMLLKAVQDVHNGSGLEEVCSKYQLAFKTEVLDQRKPNISRELKIKSLHELL